MSASGTNLEERLTGYLETVAAGGSTLRELAGETIVPDRRGHPSERARAVLRTLSNEPSAQAGSRVQLEAPLGAGGMGVVHLGTQTALGRKVAVKTLRAELRSDEATVSLLREAWVTGTLEHPNVVPIYDVGLDESGAPVIVLKRIEGVQWTELMHDAAAIRERFGADDALDWNLGILMQVMNAARFAHTRGIVHRDIKPDNVMIGEFGEVYLLDWGIAVSLRDDPSGRLPLAADATELAGTPCYMAPEMLGGGAISELTDIYLLGSTLYELLAGQPPHAGESAMRILESITEGGPRVPAQAPTTLAEICRRAMHLAPDRRYGSVSEMQLALQQYRQNRGVERLVDRADEHGDALRDALAGAGDGPQERQRLYRLFGESRFGYREALAQCPHSARARRGLIVVTQVMADYELAHANPAGAANVLSELEDPPPEVAQQLERARAAEAEARERIAELEALERQYDAGPGKRTRFFLAALLGTLWTALPLAQQRLRLAFVDDNAFMIAFTVASSAAALALGVWARESLTKTAINRALAGAMALMFAGQLVFFIAAWIMGIAPTAAQVLMLGYWIVPAAVAAYFVERRLWPTVAAYIVGFLLAASAPDLRWLIMACCNAVLLANGVVVWWPGARRITPRSRSPSGPA